MNSNRRLLGRVLTVAFVSLTAAAAIASWRALDRKPVAGEIVDVLNLDGEYAVVVRDVVGDPERSFISMFHTRDGERWGALIPRYATRGSGSTGIAATSEVVTIRTVADNQPKIIAFDGRRGEKLGSVPPLGDRRSPPRSSFGLPAAGSLFARGEVFELFGQPGDWSVAVGLDLERGSLRWNADLGPAAVRRVWLRSDYLVVERPTEITVVQRRGGDVRTIPGSGPHCVTTDAIYTAMNSSLRVLSLSDLEHQTVSLGEDLILAGICGRRGRALVLAATHRDGGSTLLAADVQALERGTLRLLWRIDFDNSWMLDQIARRVPDRTPLAGQLTRFVPLLLAAPNVLAAIDIDTGSLAWSSWPRPSLGDAYLISGQDKHYLYEPKNNILASLSGTSGTLDAAVKLPDYIAVQPRHIAGNRIWIATGQQWTVLDATTLQGAPEVDKPAGIRDIRSQLRQDLAPPRPIE
ncbi:MAG: hypothetical protein MJE77_42565 [Proteobacteria bacterium]|nr:hypothetical protein [Pseudomonadota bacterium]